MTGHVRDSDKLSFKSPWWLFAQLRHRRNRCPLGWWKKRRRWPRPRPPRCWNCVWSWKCKGQRAATACGRDLAEPIERSAGGPLAGQTNATVGGQGKDKKKMIWIANQNVKELLLLFVCVCENLHNSKRRRWFGWCFARPGRRLWGRAACGPLCSLPGQCWVEWRWPTPGRWQANWYSWLGLRGGSISAAAPGRFYNFIFEKGEEKKSG